MDTFAGGVAIERRLFKAIINIEKTDLNKIRREKVTYRNIVTYLIE